MPSFSATTPSSVKAVVFDLDGLMFNTEDVFDLAGRELLRRRGKEMTVGIRGQMMGRRPSEAFEVLIEELDLRDSVEVLLAESREIFEELLPERLAPMPGLYVLLEHIEQVGLPKGIATSSPRNYLERILGRFDLLERFQMTLAAEDVTQGKPHPEVYQRAAAEIGVATADMLVLEDSQAGTQAAAAARAIVVAVPHVHSREHDFSEATYVAESLHDPYVLNLLSGG